MQTTHIATPFEEHAHLAAQNFERLTGRDAHMVYAPGLARGRLTRPWETQVSTERTRTDQYGKGLYGATQEADKAVVDRLGRIAEGRGLPRAQVALGLVAAEAGGDRAYRGRHQTPASGGRGGRPRGQIVR